MKRLLFQISKIIFPFVKNTFKTKKKNDNRITIIAFKLLGDTVFTIPAIDYIKRHSGKKEIEIFCFEESKIIYELYFNNIKYQTFKKQKVKFNTRIPNFTLIKEIRKSKPFILFDLTCEYISATASLFSGANKLVGFNTYFFENIFDTFALKNEKQNLIDIHLNPVLKYYKSNGEDAIKEFPANFDKNAKILIHPFAGWKAKEWGLQKFINLAKDLHKIYDVSIICERRLLNNETIKEIEDNGIKLIFTKTIKELIYIIKDCSVMISNDTGVIYIANLLGKATFTIYGPTNPQFSLPIGKNNGFIRRVIKCSPNEDEQYFFTYGGRYCKTFECMELLEYSLVKNEIIKFLKTLEIEASKNKGFVKN